MAEEEFQESDVIFSDNISDYYNNTHDDEDAPSGGGYFEDYRGFSQNGSVSRNYNNNVSDKNFSTKKKKKMMIGVASSLPVNIPRHHHSSSLFIHCDGGGGGGDHDYHFEEFSEEDDEEAGGETVPPHVILGRRLVGKMAFSVCTGNGRTLKGRDLSQVRNSILRMTGFLEA